MLFKNVTSVTNLYHFIDKFVGVGNVRKRVLSEKRLKQAPADLLSSMFLGQLFRL